MLEDMANPSAAFVPDYLQLPHTNERTCMRRWRDHIGRSGVSKVYRRLDHLAACPPVEQDPHAFPRLVDDEERVLVLSGRVRQEDITQQNTVLSSQIAELAIVMHNEGEIRDAHVRLDGVMCALESLLQSPAMTPALRVAIRDAIEPAASALTSGANRMIARVVEVDPGVASGW